MAIFRATAQIAQDRLAALGLACVCWSHLEQRIEQTIWAFRGINRKAGRKITSNMASIKPRINALLTEIHKSNLSTKDKNAMDKLVCHIRDELLLERNWMVHGLWCKGLEPGMRRKTYAITYYWNPDGDHREMPIGYLQNFVFRVSHTANALERCITQRIGAPLP